MSNNDYLEAQLFGGIFGLVISVLLAPLFLFIYVMGLFFRAPLAAIFASIVCGFIAWVLFLLTKSIAANMSPFGGFIFQLFMCCVAAGAAYGIRTVNFSLTVFNWECAVLGNAISRFGSVGRAFYIFAQIIPGLILLVLVIGTTLAEQNASFAATSGEKIFFLIVLGWFALSQLMVLRFHRTDHPIGQHVSFTGIPFGDFNESEVGHEFDEV